MTSTTSSQPSSTTDQPTASCTTAVPGKYGNVPFDACNSYYNFNPQFPAAVAVSVLFSILTIAHITQAAIYKKTYCWVLIMASLWETLAFVFQALGSHNQQNIGYATAHSLLFLLAPLWINAFVYMTFSRLVYYILPEKTVCGIKASKLAKYFVWFDIISFIVQAAGGVMAGPGASPNVIKIGIDVYMSGIGLQEAFILFFTFLMITFHRRAISLEREGMVTSRERSWRPLLFALYTVLLAITVRIIYRIAEYASGIQPSNPVPFHEVYSYVLDAFPMMLAILTLAVIHPGRALVGPGSEFPKISRKGRKALKKEKKEAKREEKVAKREERRARKETRNSGKPIPSVEVRERGVLDV